MWNPSPDHYFQRKPRRCPVPQDAQAPCLPEATCLEGCQEHRPSGLVDVRGALVQERFQLPLLPRASLRRPAQVHPDLRALTEARVRRHPGVKREGLLNKVLHVIKPGAVGQQQAVLWKVHVFTNFFRLRTSQGFSRSHS